jgi:hypothetical protein
MHEALNVDETKKLIAQFTVNSYECGRMKCGTNIPVRLYGPDWYPA